MANITTTSTDFLEEIERFHTLYRKVLIMK